MQFTIRIPVLYMLLLVTLISLLATFAPPAVAISAAFLLGLWTWMQAMITFGRSVQKSLSTLDQKITRLEELQSQPVS